MQKGGESQHFLSHKCTPDNCSIYVASVKGKALRDVCIPLRIDKRAVPTQISCVSFLEHTTQREAF